MRKSREVLSSNLRRACLPSDSPGCCQEFFKDNHDSPSKTVEVVSFQVTSMLTPAISPARIFMQLWRVQYVMSTLIAVTAMFALLIIFIDPGPPGRSPIVLIYLDYRGPENQHFTSELKKLKQRESRNQCRIFVYVVFWPL